MAAVAEYRQVPPPPLARADIHGVVAGEVSGAAAEGAVAVLLDKFRPPATETCVITLVAFTLRPATLPPSTVMAGWATLALRMSHQQYQSMALWAEVWA